MELSVPTPTEIIINYSSKIYLERCLETPLDNTVMVFFILFFTILKKEFYFIFFLFSFLCAEPLLLQGLFSSCGDWGLLWLWFLLLQITGFRARGLSSWVSGLESTGPAVVGRGLSCCSACGIFLDQGSNPCLLHFQADSLPLSHRRSLVVSLISKKILTFIGGGGIIITNLGENLLCDMHCTVLHFAITAPSSCNNPELPTILPVCMQLSNCSVYIIGYNPSNNPMRPVCARTGVCACVCVLLSCVRFCDPCQALCPWDFPGENTGVGSHSLLQGIFLMQGSFTI